MKSLNEILGVSREPVHEVFCMDCGELTTCSGLAWEIARNFNHELARRGEAVLCSNELVRCPRCRELLNIARAEAASRSHWAQKTKHEDKQTEHEAQTSLLWNE